LELHRLPRDGARARALTLLTRRGALIGLGLGLGALALPGLPRRVLAAPAREASALAIVYLNGGRASLFNSAGLFLRSGAFGVTHDNVKAASSAGRSARRTTSRAGPRP
jgi:hypothetical protein